MAADGFAIPGCATGAETLSGSNYPEFPDSSIPRETA